MSDESIARNIAKAWGLAGSTNLVQWALLALLLGMLLAGPGAWYVRSQIAEGEVAKVQQAQAETDNKALSGQLQQASTVITAQQKAVAESSRRLQEAFDRLDAINLETARERDENRRQMSIIRTQLEGALKARPDLADVRVGSELQRVWNAANRGRATAAPAGSNAGAAQPAAPVRPGKSAAVPGGVAGGADR